MIDIIETATSAEHLKSIIQDEKDNAEIHRLKNWSNKNMARVILAHKYGEGDCNCSQCGN